MRIVPLSARPDVMVSVAALMQAEWPGWYGPGGQGRALEDLAERCRSRGLPWGLVALDDTDAVLGTGALTPTSYGALPGEGPWIGGLVVAPQARGQGIGSALVAALEARAAGQSQGVHVTTQAAVSLLRRRGWSVLRHHGAHAILFKDLTG